MVRLFLAAVFLRGWYIHISDGDAMEGLILGCGVVFDGETVWHGDGKEGC